jgi:DNA-binding transcriptional LysR family regulator
VAEHGCPRSPDDLGRHRCISYRHASSGALHRWEFEHDGVASSQAVPSSFVTNDVDVMRDAALAGLGIACLINEQASADILSGRLVEVLPGWAPTLPPNHLYYPSRRQPTAAFRAFLEAMRIAQHG